MNKEEILKELDSWYKQDKENRAILYFAVERKPQNDTENTIGLSLTQGFAGKRKIVKSMIKNAIKNDIVIAKTFRDLLAELAFEAFVDAFQKSIKKNDNETSEEEKK